MGIIKTIFGKNADELYYQDIEAFFIKPQDESNKLEFKSYHLSGNHDKMENAILSTIGAMLNSDGGLIIWGAPEGSEVPKKKEKVFIGSLKPLPKTVERDRFMQRVASNITPTPLGVTMFEYTDGNSFVYLFEVEQSQYSPHQSFSSYEMRMDGHTRAAPHHYVEALFRKVTFPRLEGYLRFGPIKRQAYGPHILVVRPCIFNLSKLQNEQNVYLRLMTSLRFHENEVGVGGQNVSRDRRELVIPEVKPVLFYNEPATFDIEVEVLDHVLHRDDFKAEFYLVFGGKTSPLRRSMYTVNLYDLSGDINGKVEECTLNQYIHEAGDPNETEQQKVAKTLALL